MSKIGIVTLYGQFNFGNRLQNYALTEVLKDWNCEVNTVVPVMRPIEVKIKNYVKKRIANVDLLSKSRRFSSIRRQNKFISFTEKYIPTIFVKRKDLEKIGKDYSYFLVGSDQVWNPLFGGFDEQSDYFFLKFIPQEKRVCAVPSFGIDKIPVEWEETVREGLLGFNHISVREYSGKAIVQELIHKEAVVLIDPTMMLTQFDWQKISKPINGLPQKYIADYYLGEKSKDQLDEQYSTLDIIDAFTSKYGEIGPEEFIFLISNAELVRTDSFHACVFSILFGKPFLVYRRKDSNKDMYSRIDSLLSMFGVKNEGRIIRISEDVVNEVLDYKRKEFLNYLAKEIGNEKST